MKCFWCLVEWQANERENIEDAGYVFDGKSCCLHHVNTKRGLPENFQRYPDVRRQKMGQHLHSVHNYTVYLGDTLEIHAEDYPDCAYVPEVEK